MSHRTRLAALALALSVLALAAPAAATALSPGADSLGDKLFPQIGNGGYDVSNYDIALNYDPVANTFHAGTQTAVTATATKALSSFSLDFQRNLKVSTVTIDGQPATFEQRKAKPRLSRNREVTQPAKLFVTPPGGIADGRQFVAEIAYAGGPEAITDSDGSIEGWVQACSSPGHCDGSFTVNEPIGAQSWFPSNNYMTDKASISTSITVPSQYTALGAGELALRDPGPNGTTTWHWVEDDPTATYLASATVGRFDYTDDGTLFERSTGATLPIYGAVDSAGSAVSKRKVGRSVRLIPSMVNYLSKRFGPYPLDSIGYVADWVPAVGYALENQSKPHFSGNRQGPALSDRLLMHEVAHQWMGNSVTGRGWKRIWFNEGWATFMEVFWSARVNGAKQSPRQFFRDVLAVPNEEFRLAPAEIRDPADLFAGFAVYSRPGAMLEGYRQIVGNKRFFRFALKLNTRFGHATIGERQFVREAQRSSGLGRKGERRLGAYFREWLHRNSRPTLTPADFGGRPSGGGKRQGTSEPDASGTQELLDPTGLRAGPPAAR